jgi:hypothetical protein
VAQTNDAGVAYANMRMKNVRTNVMTYFSTNANGFYQTTADTGHYQISLNTTINNCTSPIACPSNNLLLVNADTLYRTYPNNNFYYNNSGLVQNDLLCNMNSPTARPGFAATFSLYYRNDRNTTVPNVKLTFTKANRWTNLIMQSGSPLYNNQNGDTYTWNLGTLAPYSSGNIRFRMDLPLSTPAGISLTNSLVVNTTTTDCNPANNTFVYNQITTNSYDPNDKTLLNAQNDMGGVLNDGADLNYQIRFQNTGTDTAYTVVVRDSIDASRLDLQSLKITAASHNVALRWESPNVAVFEFLNINLVDSLHNEPDSHGFIQYTVAPLANIPMFGTTDNTANIFFDFNDPVRTNTVHTTFVPFLATNTPAAFAPSIVLQPNPTADVLIIKTDIANAYTLTLQDALGRILQTQTIAQASTELNVQHLPQGTYFIQIKTAEGQITKRFVKM